MERHWETVTRRLSDATTRDIAMLLGVYESYPHDDGYKKLINLAQTKLNLSLQILPPQDLPPTALSAGKSANRSASRSGSTPSGGPIWWKSVSS